MKTFNFKTAFNDKPAFNYKKVIATTAFVALATPMISNAAIKTTAYETSEVSVAYSAAELNSVTGRARIENKIRQAANKVCGKVSIRQPGSVRQAMKTKTCFNDAVAKAMDNLEQGLAVTSR